MNSYLIKTEGDYLYKVYYKSDDTRIYFNIDFIECYNMTDNVIEKTRPFFNGYLKDQGDTLIIQKMAYYISNVDCFNDIDVIVESLKIKFYER